jgi:hypothetical protein
MNAKKPYLLYSRADDKRFFFVILEYFTFKKCLIINSEYPGTAPDLSPAADGQLLGQLPGLLPGHRN